MMPTVDLGGFSDFLAVDLRRGRWRQLDLGVWWQSGAHLLNGADRLLVGHVEWNLLMSGSR